mmetsp:Transcript_13247/g.19795  ORF Transcript_13247/g.19795 Transcript_13247/m.19795 type:complete len:520 (-) Transcript_13247:122-1681(-)
MDEGLIIWNAARAAFALGLFVFSSIKARQATNVSHLAIHLSLGISSILGLVMFMLLSEPARDNVTWRVRYIVRAVHELLTGIVGIYVTYSSSQVVPSIKKHQKFNTLTFASLAVILFLSFIIGAGGVIITGRVEYELVRWCGMFLAILTCCPYFLFCVWKIRKEMLEAKKALKIIKMTSRAPLRIDNNTDAHTHRCIVTTLHHTRTKQTRSNQMESPVSRNLPEMKSPSNNVRISRTNTRNTGIVSRISRPNTGPCGIVSKPSLRQQNSGLVDLRISRPGTDFTSRPQLAHQNSDLTDVTLSPFKTGKSSTTMNCDLNSLKVPNGDKSCTLMPRETSDETLLHKPYTSSQFLAPHASTSTIQKLGGAKTVSVKDISIKLQKGEKNHLTVISLGKEQKEDMSDSSKDIENVEKSVAEKKFIKQISKSDRIVALSFRSLPRSNLQKRDPAIATSAMISHRMNVYLILGSILFVLILTIVIYIMVKCPLSCSHPSSATSKFTPGRTLAIIVNAFLMAYCSRH